MAFVASGIPWTPVSARVWTRIAQGPLIQGLPFQFLQLAPFGFTPPRTVSVTWTLDGYSASPPFYARTAGTTPASSGVLAAGFEVGSTAVMTSFHSSLWVEFWLLTNVACFAQMHLV